jgi:hypothetical protein
VFNVLQSHDILSKPGDIVSLTTPGVLSASYPQNLKVLIIQFKVLMFDIFHKFFVLCSAF